MQIPPVQTPVVPNAQPQEAAAKMMPHIHPQAAPPIITQKAIDPAKKPDRGNQSRNNGDKAKGGGSDGERRGGSLNIRV